MEQFQRSYHDNEACRNQAVTGMIKEPTEEKMITIFGNLKGCHTRREWMKTKGLKIKEADSD